MWGVCEEWVFCECNDCNDCGDCLVCFELCFECGLCCEDDCGLCLLCVEGDFGGNEGGFECVLCCEIVLCGVLE